FGSTSPFLGEVTFPAPSPFAGEREEVLPCNRAPIAAFCRRARNGGMSVAEGKVAVVTGATSGIGRAVALGFARAGYRLAVCGRRAARLEDVLDASRLGDDRIIGRKLDVTDHPAVRGFFAETVQHFGRVDVLFN